MPQGRNDHIDLEGNRVTQVWFGSDTDHLHVDLTMQIETSRQNPFDFILDPEALSLPGGTVVLTRRLARRRLAPAAHERGRPARAVRLAA